MSGYAFPIEKLIDELSRLPGIGRKSAVRLTYYILGMPESSVRGLSEALVEAKMRIHHCKECCNLTDGEYCPICADLKRNRSVICVVEQPKDVIAIEKGGSFDGLYHVLHGALSPMDGIGPSDIKIRELMVRLNGDISEVILATNPTVEGEATATYISRLVKEMGIKVTRIAHGVPVGGDLEYFDSMTLKMALDHRIEI